jgi:hypothetical protein
MRCSMRVMAHTCCCRWLYGSFLLQRRDIFVSRQIQKVLYTVYFLTVGHRTIESLFNLLFARRTTVNYLCLQNRSGNSTYMFSRTEPPSGLL